MESVIAEKVAPEDIILRFDYKQLGDGITVNQGKEYELLLEDWLIDYSPYPTDEDRVDCAGLGSRGRRNDGGSLHV